MCVIVSHWQHRHKEKLPVSDCWHVFLFAFIKSGRGDHQHLHVPVSISRQEGVGCWHENYRLTDRKGKGTRGRDLSRRSLSVQRLSHWHDPPPGPTTHHRTCEGKSSANMQSRPRRKQTQNPRERQRTSTYTHRVHWNTWVSKILLSVCFRHLAWFPNILQPQDATDLKWPPVVAPLGLGDRTTRDLTSYS